MQRWRRSSSHPLGTGLQAGSWGITNLLSWRGTKKKRARSTPGLCDCAVPPPSLQHSGFNFPACFPCAIPWQQWQMCQHKCAFSCTELWKLHLSLMQCSKDICNITLEMTGPWRQAFFFFLKHVFFSCHKSMFAEKLPQDWEVSSMSAAGTKPHRGKEKWQELCSTFLPCKTWVRGSV